MCIGPTNCILARRTLVAAMVLAAGLAAPAHAQSFPSNVIHIIVPPGPGTPPDVLTRMVADEVAAAEGWRVVVENRPGALQTIAMADVAKRPADGYSLLVMSLPMMVTPSLMPNAGVRPDTDFAPVIKISRSYNALVTTASLPMKSVSELVSLLKRKPGQLNFSSAGFGTPSHLIGEIFELQAGVRATHVPYQQFPQAIADLISGTNQYMFATTLPIVDLVATGKLHALAVTAPRRIAVLSDVPTVAEAGYPGLLMEDWVGFAVRKGTPAEAVAQLNRAFNRALATPKVHDAFVKLGADAAGGSPGELGELIKTQVAYWGNAIKEANIKLP